MLCMLPESSYTTFRILDTVISASSAPAETFPSDAAPKQTANSINRQSAAVPIFLAMFFTIFLPSASFTDLSLRRPELMSAGSFPIAQERCRYSCTSR